MSASLQFTMSSLLGDMPTSRTEYIFGRNTRSEIRSCFGHSSATPPADVRYEYGPLVAHIHNRDLGYSFSVDLEKRLYTAYRANEYGSPAWLKPRISPLKPSGKTVHILTDTIDTGDRKTMFGYTARRVVTKSRTLRDSQLLSESECDGWYIDPPSAWVNLHPPNARTFCVVSLASDGSRDEFKFTETGTRETGFVVQATRAARSFFRDEAGNIKCHETIVREEITAFSESPLPAALFAPHPDFRRVLQLPDQARNVRPLPMRFRWEMLKDFFLLRSKIDGFTGSRSPLADF